MVRVRYSFGSRHTGRIGNIRKQRNKYPDVMRDVIRISDIILEVLDARFIEGTRNPEAEGDILDNGKLLIYVINKSDLIDIEELKSQLPNWMKPYVFVSATANIGLKDLKGRIKMEAKRILKRRNEVKIDKGNKNQEFNEIGKDKGIVKDMNSKKRIHVGVIGYPNAGKSSVINFITKKGAARTAKQAGFTKGMQKIRMSEDILILDTPGVIPANRYSTETKSFSKDVKVGGRTYSDVKNPEDIVFYLIKAKSRVDEKNPTDEELQKEEEALENSKAIDKFYGIESKGDVEVLIEELGKGLKHFGKGGKIDVDRTARIILRDWQKGKIKV